MKIAIIINTSWNIYNFRKGLVEALLKRGNEMLAIAPRDAYSPKLESLGCTFHELPMEGSGMNPWKDLQLLVRMIRILKSERPEILLTYTIKPNIYGSIASFIVGVPCICNVSGLGTVFLWKGYVKKIAILLYSFAFRFSKWIFFQNADDQKEFLTLIPVRAEKTSILPGSGVDLNRFVMEEMPVNQTASFLMIARIIVEKGVFEYVEAAKILRSKGVNARFLLIGSLDESHQRAISKHQIDEWAEDSLIEYLEHQEDIRPFIKAADAVILPSYREGTPKTLLEAGAMGKALIATRVPGCKEVVKEGVNGFLCEPKNSKDLAAKIRLYLSLSESERLEMGRNSRKLIEEKFDEKRVIDEYMHKIDEFARR